jgi:hypothetical protein
MTGPRWRLNHGGVFLHFTGCDDSPNMADKVGLRNASRCQSRVAKRIFRPLSAARPQHLWKLLAVQRARSVQNVRIHIIPDISRRAQCVPYSAKARRQGRSHLPSLRTSSIKTSESSSVCQFSSAWRKRSRTVISPL